MMIYLVNKAWHITNGLIFTSIEKENCFIFYFSLKLFKKFYIFIFRERRKGGGKRGRKHQCTVASHVAPTAELARNPGMCPDWESNLQPFDSHLVFNPLSYPSQSYFSYAVRIYVNSYVFITGL